MKEDQRDELRNPESCRVFEKVKESFMLQVTRTGWESSSVLIKGNDINVVII
jgi:hypothetical protein